MAALQRPDQSAQVIGVPSDIRRLDRYDVASLMLRFWWCEIALWALLSLWLLGPIAATFGSARF